MVGIEEQKVSEKIPSPVLFLIVLSVVLVGGVVLLVLFPQYREIEGLKQEQVSATIDLKTQEKLYPLFAEARALASIGFEPKLPVVERIPLGRNKIVTLSDLFSTIALSNNMVLSSNSLDLNSLKRSSDSVSMAFTFSGDLFDYRRCLISLASLPFFNSIENIKIVTDQDRVKQFFTEIMINIDN